jgi:hypothetical protein
MAPVVIEEYPKILYHTDGSAIQVENEAEERTAIAKHGFLESPPSSAPPEPTGTSGYVPVEYPKVLYDGKGGTRTVLDPEGEAKMATLGFVEDVNGPPLSEPLAGPQAAPPPSTPPPPAASAVATEFESFAPIVDEDLPESPIVVPDEVAPPKAKGGRPTKAAAALKAAEKKAAAEEKARKKAEKAAKATK